VLARLALFLKCPKNSYIDFAEKCPTGQGVSAGNADVTKRLKSHFFAAYFCILSEPEFPEFTGLTEWCDGDRMIRSVGAGQRACPLSAFILSEPRYPGLKDSQDLQRDVRNPANHKIFTTNNLNKGDSQ